MHNQSFLKQSTLRFLLMTSVVLFLFVFLVCPLALLFVKAFQDKQGVFVGFQQFYTYFQSTTMIQSFSNSVYISIWSTICSVSLALLTSYCFSHFHIPMKSFFRCLMSLPLFAPSMLLGLTLVYLFGNQGLFTQLGWSIPLYGSLGIILALTLYCFPIAFMILNIAFSTVDIRLYEAADTMGTSSFRKFLTITLPSIKYGLLSAIFISFTYSFTDFGAPSIVGGNYSVLATDIYKQVIGQHNFNIGAVIGIILLIPALLSFVMEHFTTKKDMQVTSKAMSYHSQGKKKGHKLAMICVSVVSFAILGFFLIAGFVTFIKSWPYDFTLTLMHYDFSKIASGQGFWNLKNSVLVAILTAIFGTIFTFMSAYIVEKSKGYHWLRKSCHFLSTATNAIPGTVLGLGFILFFNRQAFPIPGTQWELVNYLSAIYGTYTILIVVNIIHYFSVPYVSAQTALKKLDPEYEMVSDSLQVPFTRTLWKVTIPLCKHTIIQMAVYYFINSMVTISAVVFLYTPITRLASITVMNMNDAGDILPATAMCIIIFVMNLCVKAGYESYKIWTEKKQVKRG